MAGRAIHGFYKLPDYQGPKKKYLWRGESFLTGDVKLALDVKEVERRINAIGKDPEPAFGFTSTSAQGLDQKFAGNCLTLLLYEEGGKDVSKYSKYHGETEILFPPTQIQWLYHKELESGGHLFIARPVQTYRQPSSSLEVQAK
jgi:hypothetical protein